MHAQVNKSSVDYHNRLYVMVQIQGVILQTKRSVFHIKLFSMFTHKVFSWRSKKILSTGHPFIGQVKRNV